MPFSDLPLHPLILQALELEGYAEPTPVQAAALPPGLEGKDVLASAETGTGKTAAFLLPILQRLSGEKIPRPAGAPRMLVLVPTRELARQVMIEARKLGTFLRLAIVELVGGMPYRDQQRVLSKTVDIVVATPGRLMDHVERGRLFLDNVEVLVLDEADRMLDMGFRADVEALAGACRRQRQSLLFTATLGRGVETLAGKLLKNPVRIAAESQASKPQIDQRLFHADDLTHKRKLLLHFAAMPQLEKAIVFTATKRDADLLARELADAGFAAAPMHGDLAQDARHRTIEQLRKGELRLIVATDVAARGLDLPDLSHVINFDLPRVPEDYVHRIGRTGRAGASGIALSLAGRADREALARIEELLKTTLKPHQIKGLEAKKALAPLPAGKPVQKAGAKPGKPGQGKAGPGKAGQGKSGKPAPSKNGPSSAKGKPATPARRPAKGSPSGGSKPLSRKPSR